MKHLAPENGVALSDAMYLECRRQIHEVGVSSLQLVITDHSHAVSREVAIRLDPWDPEGYLVEHRQTGNILIICGSDAIALVDLAAAAAVVVIPLEFEECKTLEQPWVVQSRDHFIVATDSRVFCFDNRGSIEWIWTVRDHSSGASHLRAQPLLEGDRVVLALGSFKGDATLTLSVHDGKLALKPS